MVTYLADRGASLGNGDVLDMGFTDLVRSLVDDWGFEALVVWRATEARDVRESGDRLLEVMDEGRRIIAER